MMVNPCATILPLIIFWLPSLSFLPNLKRPFTRKKVVAPQPIGRKGFSLNFLTSFSEGASWCFFPVSLFTANSLFNCIHSNSSTSMFSLFLARFLSCEFLKEYQDEFMFNDEAEKDMETG